MKKKMKWMNEILLAVLIIVMLTACSGQSATATTAAATTEANATETTAMDVTVSTSGDSVIIENESEAYSAEIALSGEVSLPDGYPEDDLPVYTNSRVYIAAKDGENYTIAMKTDDAIEDVYDYYVANAKLDQVMMQQLTEDMGMIMGSYGNYNVSITITPNNFDDDGKYLIGIAIGN